MIREITPEEFWASEKVPELIRGYAEECHTAGLPAPNPDKELYAALHQYGILRVLGAFVDEAMVGFAVVMSTRAPHYNAVLTVMESLYLDPEHRQGGTGWRLIKAAERMAQEVESTGLFISAPAGGALESVLKGDNSGYRHSNTVFFREFE